MRKDLVKLVKGNAIGPSYVLEYLLGQSAVSDDEATIQKGDEFPCERSESNSGGGRWTVFFSGCPPDYGDGGDDAAENDGSFRCHTEPFVQAFSSAGAR